MELLASWASRRLRRTSSTPCAAWSTGATIRPASPPSRTAHLDRRRAEGKLKNLEQRLHNSPLQGRTGLGHTRWATHGKPVEHNAHPHMNDRVAVVHNGIIENFQELKEELSAKGHRFETETDTETVLHLRQRLPGPGPAAG